MDITQLEEPLIIAHRGLKKYYPENTLTGFEAAIAHGAAMIELDVSLSKDRKVVVIHDDTLDRTTNGSGLVSDHTLRELKRLDAGSWFSDRFKNEKLPILYEVFEKYATKAAINIEIKPEAFDINQQIDSIENQVVDLIHQFNCFDSVIISSFEKKLLHRFNGMTHKPLLSFLSEEPLTPEIITFIKENSIYSWNPDFKILTQSHVQLMQENNIKIFSYTVNEKETAEKLFNMGVNGIFTDDITSFS